MNKIHLLLLVLLIGACSEKSTDQATADPHDHAHEENAANIVELDPQQIATLGITTTTMQKRSMEGHVRLSGRIMASPVSKAQITSPIGAKVIDVLVEEGSPVKKGQPLIALADMQFLRMQEEFLVTQAQLERASTDLERQRTLVVGNATARKTFEQAQSEAVSLEARKKSLADQLRMLGVDVDRLSKGTTADRFVLRSPIEGRVNNISIFLDARVEPTTVLLEVIDLDHFHVHMNAYERDLASITEGAKFNFQVMNLPRQKFTGEIFSIGRSFDADGRSIPVHAHVIEGSEKLVEGMSVSAEVPSSKSDQWALPDAAVHRSGAKGALFLLTDSTDQHMIFERIAITPQTSADGFTSFTTDREIPENARFAADKVFYLWSTLENAGGHEH